MDDLISKLRPARFPGMSPFMAAVVGYVLGQSYTDPEIEEITVSEHENLVYIRQQGQAGFGAIESLVDLRNNWNHLIDAAGLTADQRKEAVRLFGQRVLKLPGTEVG